MSALRRTLRLTLFRKLLHLPVSYYNDRRSGAIQSVLLNDVNVYQNAVGIIRDSIQGPIQAVGAFLMVFYFCWKIACLALLLIPVMAYVIDRNKRRMKVAQTEVQENLAEVSANTLEVLNGIRVVKGFSAEDRVRSGYEKLIEKAYTSQVRAVRITASLRPLTDLIGASGLALSFFLCGILALRRELTPGDVVAIAYGMDMINQGFRSVGGVTNTFATVQAASDRIYSEILDQSEEPELLEGRTLVAPRGHICFESVSFSYPDGTKALNSVSFEIRPDTSLALVGPSGAGKSTIADLLLRFYDPTEGRILLDGVDIRDLNVRWLRSLIGVVPQQTFLFAGTIEENLRLGAAQATQEELNSALKQASAADFVKEIENRASSELGERGVRLSGGQMQRVAIARALIRKPTILLLDEATSALDANSERAVTEALNDVMKSRTTLFIAHRLTTAARADRILVLSHGEVLEEGSHSELLQANGTYAGLFKAFSGGILSSMPSAGAVTISCRSLTCGFQGHPILTDVELQIAAGESVALLGLNGAGKSTLLKTLSGELKPLRGRVDILFRQSERLEDLSSFAPPMLARTIAVVPQEEPTPFPFSVRQLVTMGRLAYGSGIFDSDEDSQAATDAMSAVECLHLADRPVTELSGGEKQRSLLARAIAQNASVLLLDEPTSHLDATHQLSIATLLKELAQRGQSLLTAVHDLNLASTFATRALVLSEGRVAMDGDVESVMMSNKLDACFRCSFERLRTPSGRLVLMPTQTL